MRVGPLGEVVLIDNPADVCWYSSHHNFNDWAHAWSGSRHYEVRVFAYLSGCFRGLGARETLVE